LITPDPREYYLGQSWSLCYEEQFYLIFGLILLVAANRMFMVSSAISVLVVVTFLGARAAGIDISGTFLDGRWLTFAAGILVYWVLNYAPEGARKSYKAGLLVALLLLAGLMLYPPTRTWISLRLAYIELATATAFAAALTFLHPYDRRIAQSRLLAPLAWCGTMSYSIYLVHWTVVKPLSRWLWVQGVTGPAATLLITLPLCAIAAIVVGRLFFLGVERHFLNSPAMKPAEALPKLTPVA
jgi:peptidoglycan/LPS O-acetylase OafA/YrhL